MLYCFPGIYFYICYFFFQGKTFYLTPSVVPGRTWLKEIIECAGGTVDNKLRSVKDVKEKNK